MDYQVIAETLLKDVPSCKGRPFYVLAAGGPASHKCFFDTFLKAHDYQSYICIGDELLEQFFSKSEKKYPHHEKSAEHIVDYYKLIDAIVAQAIKQNISIVLEDHCDYPAVYQRHIDATKNAGYNNFLLFNTITPTNFKKKIDFLIDHSALPNFIEWGKAYHLRADSCFERLLSMFDNGMLIEHCPSFVSEDGKPHADIIAQSNKKKQNGMEVLNAERYEEFKQWEAQQVDPEFISYFKNADRVMQETSFEPIGTDIGSGGRARQQTNQRRASFLDRVIIDMANKTPSRP